MQALATVALLTSLLGAGPPADPVLAEARAHVEVAKKAFAARKYTIALQEFQTAQKLKPAPVIWFNIGKCYDKLDDPTNALKAYQIYLLESPNAPDRKVVNASIAQMEDKLRARGVQMLLVVTQPPGAIASVIKGPLPAGLALQTPAAFEARAGTYTFGVSLNGYQKEERQVTMKSKGTVLLELVLKAETSVPMPPPPPPPVASVSPTPPDNGPPAAETKQGTVTVAVRPNAPPPPAMKTDRPVQTRPPPVNSPSITEPPRTPLASGPPPEPRGRILTWVAGGLAVAGAGAGAGFGVMANSASAELRGSLHTEEEANALYARTKSSALYSNIGYGAAAAAGLAAVILFFVEAPPSGAQAMTSPSGGPPVVLSF